MSRRHLYLFLSVLAVFALLEMCSNDGIVRSQTGLNAVQTDIRPDPTRAWVVFSRTDASGKPWLWALPGVGVQPVRLFEGSLPARSPAGDQVAFCRDFGDDGSTVYRAPLLDKSPSVMYLSKQRVHHLAWSPRGTHLALGLLDDIVLVRIDGAQATPLNLSRLGIGFVFNPMWMPDGESIVFHDNEQLYVVSTRGTLIRSQKLTTYTSGLREFDSANDSTDRFAPCPTEAGLLAFSAKVPGTPAFDRFFNGEPNTALFLYDRVSATRRRLTPANLLATDPVWSRDGKTVWFTGYTDRDGSKADPWKVYRINRDGTGLTMVTRGEHPAP